MTTVAAIVTSPVDTSFKKTARAATSIKGLAIIALGFVVLGFLPTVLGAAVGLPADSMFLGLILFTFIVALIFAVGSFLANVQARAEASAKMRTTSDFLAGRKRN